jgi:hypothetical protein
MDNREVLVVGRASIRVSQEAKEHQDKAFRVVKTVPVTETPAVAVAAQVPQVKMALVAAVQETAVKD